MATQEAEAEEATTQAEADKIPAEDGPIPAEEVEAEVEAVKTTHTTIPRRTFNACIATSTGTIK
jgi:hypothetical protein